jgi:hypothetical protein
MASPGQKSIEYFLNNSWQFSVKGVEPHRHTGSSKQHNPGSSRCIFRYRHKHCRQCHQQQRSFVVYATAAAMLNGCSFSGVNGFQFQVAGVPGFNYAVQESTNLIDWVSLITNTSPFSFTDTNTASFPQQFYPTFYVPGPAPVSPHCQLRRFCWPRVRWCGRFAGEMIFRTTARNSPGAIPSGASGGDFQNGRAAPTRPAT